MDGKKREGRLDTLILLTYLYSFFYMSYPFEFLFFQKMFLRIITEHKLSAADINICRNSTNTPVDIVTYTHA